MKEQKRIQNGFNWTSNSISDTRIPLFWIAKFDNELYFVNDSKETLDLVKAYAGGFQTCDEDVLTISDNTGQTYYDVLPNEAVKIEEYDGFYDLDFVLDVSLLIQSKTKGVIEITTFPKKGGISKTVILWDNNEWGKNIRRFSQQNNNS